MASTFDARFQRKVREEARVWMEEWVERLRLHPWLDRIQVATRNLSNSEVGSVLFFLALILTTFLF